VPYFAHDGIRFFYEQAGEGVDFVYSHGLGARLERVSEFVQNLPGVRVTIYDNRGHGRTVPAPNPERLNFREMAGDVAALFGHLAISKAIVGGVSMGSGVALRFALTYPERVRALVLNRPAWTDRPNPENLGFAPILAPALATGDRARALTELWSSSYYRTLTQEDPLAAALLGELILRNEPRALAACYRGIVSSAPLDTMNEMRSVRVPALVLGCRDDAFHPIDVARSWAETLPCARFVEICPSSINAERHVSDFRQAVSEFLHEVLKSPELKGSHAK
jgi:pimeloyl-ACP methyl ester carboxylesterase